MERFLENLKSLRAEKNLTQAQLAKKIDVSREWYNRLEKNETVPNLLHIQKIAVALKINLGKLLEGSDLLNEYSELKKLERPVYDMEKLQQYFDEKFAELTATITLINKTTSLQSSSIITQIKAKTNKNKKYN